MRSILDIPIGRKLVLLIVITTTTALLLIAAAFIAYDYVSTRHDAAERLATMARMVANNSNAALAFGDAKNAEEVLHSLQGEEEIQSACTYNVSNEVIAEFHRHAGDQCPSGAVVTPDVVFAHAEAMYCQAVLLNDKPTGFVYLRSNLAQMQYRRAHFAEITFIFLIVAIGVGMLLGSVIGKWIATPVVELAKLMQNVSETRNYGLRAVPRGRDEIGRLVAGFNNMLGELGKREGEKKEFEDRLQFQATNDALTELPNRRLFADRLAHSVATAEREGHQMALLYIDLDGFKLVNDSLGHSIGDLLLVQVAHRLRCRIRDSDTLARIGGDEFTVILGSLHSREEAATVSQSLLDLLSQPFLIEGHRLSISASIGIGIYPEHARDSDELLIQADSAMYAAKRSGKNRVMYFTANLGAAMRERLNLENELRHAIARGEISVHYQPEFDILSNRIVRFEALARWTHPILGAISPDRFIPVAEESGIIVSLGMYIMERACTEAVQWQALAPHSIQVAVNVSSIQFSRETFVEEVTDVLGHTGLEPQQLQLELTESVMLQGVDRAAETMRRLRNLGMSLAIDDFGTGYSCLGYLPELPFDALKIDRSFVKDVDLRPEGKMMVRSLVSLAHNIGMRVIVEGVERPEEMAMIRELGGNEIQGYLMGRPTPDPSGYLSAAFPDFSTPALREFQ